MEYIDAKTIVTKNKSTAWFGAMYNMNIYRGCCHGCIYCDSRSDCYRVDDFDRVRAKKDALRIIRDDLRRKVKPGVIGTGSMSDPYNPFEKELELTRNALSLVEAYGFGVAIATKSGLITRDIDILNGIRQTMPVICKITVTTCDDSLAGKLEPNVTPPSGRFEAIKALSKAGIYCGILMMPVLPFITDNEENIIGIIERAAQAGARFIYPGFGVTLRQRQREHYLNNIERLFPEQDLEKRYVKTYGTRYSCGAPNYKKLSELFKRRCDGAGLLYSMTDIIRSYKQGYESEQLTFF